MIFIQRLQNMTGAVKALAHFDDMGIERTRVLHVKIEKASAILETMRSTSRKPAVVTRP
jgi:hypothetical protein